MFIEGIRWGCRASVKPGLGQGTPADAGAVLAMINQDLDAPIVVMSDSNDPARCPVCVDVAADTKGLSTISAAQSAFSHAAPPVGCSNVMRVSTSIGTSIAMCTNPCANKSHSRM